MYHYHFKFSIICQSCFTKTSKFLPSYCNSNTRYYIISHIKSSAFISNRIVFSFNITTIPHYILNLSIILQYYLILMADNPVCAKVLSHSLTSDSLRPHGLQPTRFFCPQNSPGKKTGVGSHFPSPGDLPQPGIKPGDGIEPGSIPIKGSNLPQPGLLHSRRVLYY